MNSIIRSGRGVYAFYSAALSIRFLFCCNSFSAFSVLQQFVFCGCRFVFQMPLLYRYCTITLTPINYNQQNDDDHNLNLIDYKRTNCNQLGDLIVDEMGVWVPDVWKEEGQPHPQPRTYQRKISASGHDI
jgi:hypothetical protein